jgi:hypothetical protein
VRKEETRTVELRIENDTVRAFMIAFIVAFTIVHGWLQAFGLYLESLFSLSPLLLLTHHSCLRPACPPFFLLSQSPDCKSKRRCYWNKSNKTRTNREKTPTPTFPSCLTTSSACQHSSVFFGQFCDLAKMAKIHSKMIYPKLPTKLHLKLQCL